MLIIGKLHTIAWEQKASEGETWEWKLGLKRWQVCAAKLLVLIRRQYWAVQIYHRRWLQFWLPLKKTQRIVGGEQAGNLSERSEEISCEMEILECMTVPRAGTYCVEVHLSSKHSWPWNGDRDHHYEWIIDWTSSKISRVRISNKSI